MDANVLLLADGRFPSGGHVQSWGIEAACALGDVTDVASLETFVRGRLATQGVVDASVAAWVAHRLANGDPFDWVDLDAQVTARMASPRLRQASRTQGRQLLRAGSRVWPSAWFQDCREASTEGPHQAVALGTVAAAAGLSARHTAAVAVHHLVASATTATVRLLGLDPFEIAALSARLADDLDRAAHQASITVGNCSTASALPASVGLLADIYAEHHATWEVRLFAS
jgi:urease accessory protein